MLHHLKTRGSRAIILGSLISGLLLASCASKPPDVQQFSATTDPSQEIDNLERNLTKASADQVDVLSPTYYKKARNSLKDAKEARNDNDGNKKILKEVAYGNAWLLKANETAKNGAEAIPDIVDVRGRALEAKANLHASDDLERADKILKDDFSEKFEEGKFSTKAKDRGDLLNKYLSIELASIKGENLDVANKNIKQAEKEGAAKVAPQTLNLARKKFKDAESFITANRQDTAGIQNASAIALAESERVLKITRDAKVTKNKSPEQLALDAENEQNAQRELSGQLDSTQTQLGEKDSAIAAMSAETSKLSGQVAIDEKYKEAKEQFSPSEADVYREGDKILIRLKGVKFPSGQADLAAASYPLMTKVQNVIKSMGSSEVEVEGHTDAVGSKDVNLRLSEARADTVKNYLVQNGAVEASNISSAGYGDQKPVTSNKTKQGRAQNRRVDVIISPM